MVIKVEQFSSDLRQYEGTASEILKPYIESVLGDLEGISDLEVLQQINVVYRARTLIRLILSGIEIASNDDEALKFMKQEKDFQNIPELPVKPELIQRLAKQLYNSINPQRGETIVLSGSQANHQVFIELVNLCEKNGVDVVIEIIDYEMDAIMLNKAENNGVQALAKERMSLYQQVNKMLQIYRNMDSSVHFDNEKIAGYRSLFTINRRIRSIGG